MQLTLYAWAVVFVAVARAVTGAAQRWAADRSAKARSIAPAVTPATDGIVRSKLNRPMRGVGYVTVSRVALVG